MTLQPAVKKTLEGHELPDNTVEKTFTFTLEEDSSNPADGAVLPTNTKLTISVNGQSLPQTATGNFDAITFTKAGTYTFTIREAAGTEPGYTYDESSWTLTVVVEDDKEGTLTIASKTYGSDQPVPGTKANEAVFTNRYQPASITAQLAVSKSVTGAQLPADHTFSFALAYSADAKEDGITLPQDRETSVTVKAGETAGTGTFDPITFTKAGTFVFSIQEDTENLPAGYDKSIQSMKRAQVTVEDQNGSLAVTKIIYYGSDISKPDAGNGAAFTNRYETQDTVFAPKVQKTLTGDTPPGDKIFTFTLKQETAQDGVKMPADPEVEITYHGRTGQASAQFDEITFTKTGNYEFIIEEVPGTAGDGYTYDPDPWTLSVEVEDLGGKLAVKEFSYRQGNTVQTGPSAAAAFENAYEVTPTDYQPMAGKVMKAGSADRPEDKSFTFTLEPAGTNPPGASIAADGKTSIVTVQPQDEAGKVILADPNDQKDRLFGKIHFERAGTYHFTIREEAQTPGKGYTYDDSVWTLTVTVEDHDSKLEVTDHTYQKNGETSTMEAAFTNDYQVKETAYTPGIEKTMSGEKRVEDAAFAFTLTPDENNPADGAVLAKDGQDASLVLNPQETQKEADFGAIVFRKAGTYRFTIVEEKGNEKGYTYDDSVWILTVEVKDLGGELTVSDYGYERRQDGEERKENALFTNLYQPQGTDFTPKVTKRMTGDDRPDETTFRFYLTPEPDNPENGAKIENGDTQAVITVPKGSAAKDEFSAQDGLGTIAFEKAGTYRFRIQEEIGDKSGYQYDGSIWTLTVVVFDTGGSLEISQAVYSAGAETSLERAVFTNRYEKPDTPPKETDGQKDPNDPTPAAAGKVSYTPAAVKKLTGDNPAEKALFSFILQAHADNPAGAVLSNSTAAVEGAGTIPFAPIVFERAGTYRFDILEAAGNAPGYRYDDSVWTLTVKVAETDGKLTVDSVGYQKKGFFQTTLQTAEFINEYRVGEPAGASQTGDSSGLLGTLAIAVISAAALLLLLIRRRKKLSDPKTE